MTLNTMTLSVKGLLATLGKTTLSISTQYHYVECCYHVCHILFIVLLNVFILNIIMLIVVMLSAFMLNVILLSIVKLSAFMLILFAE
jgi:hypothetical protein